MSAKTVDVVIPDVQNKQDFRSLPIDRVGIKSIRHPILVKDRSQHTQHTVATFSMYVDLPHNFKGTHMSRFVEILNRDTGEFSIHSFRNILEEMTRSLEARKAHVEMTFPYFMSKQAPVSKIRSLLDYEVSFIGMYNDQEKNEAVWVKIVIPVTTLCPCSKEISERGAHNQRSHITIQVQVKDFIWLEDLIEIVEKVASCELYGLLKRQDEKYVTERAYDNPKFVEDIVRDVAVQFNQNEKIVDYIVESENFESIHNHSAYAMLTKSTNTM